MDTAAALLLVALVVAAVLVWAVPDVPSRLAAWTADRPWIEVSSRLRTFFLDAAFTRDGERTAVGASTGLMKWPSGVVTVTEEGASSEFDREAVTGALRRLQRLTEGVRFRYTTRRTAEIRIRYLSHADFVRRAPASSGVAAVYRLDSPGAASELSEVTILVDSRPSNGITGEALLLRGLMRAVGFPGQPDDAASPPSVLCRSGRRATGLLSIDRRSIRLLYDKELKAGMSRAEVETALVER